MSSTTPSGPEPQFNPLAALLAWLWPGLGHFRRGERRRGALIMFGVLFLFFSGLLIGGVDVVDRQRDRLWFLAQMFCGPVAFAADFASQSLVSRPPPSWRGDQAWRSGYVRRDDEVIAQLHGTSLGKVNEIGTLYVALAGLMNLVVILDALHRPSRPEPDPS